MTKKERENEEREKARQRSERARNAAQCRWNSHNVEKQMLREDPDPVFRQLLKAYSGRPMD